MERNALQTRYAGTLVMYNFAIAPTPLNYLTALSWQWQQIPTICVRNAGTQRKTSPSIRRLSVKSTVPRRLKDRFMFFFCSKFNVRRTHPRAISSLLMCILLYFTYTLSQRTVENIGQVLGGFIPVVYSI